MAGHMALGQARSGGVGKKGFWACTVAGYMGIECAGPRAYSYGTS